MNFAGSQDQNSILCVSLDHNNAALAIGRHNGFKLLSHDSVDVLKTIYDSASENDLWWRRLTHRIDENIHIIEMVFSMQIVATVSLDSPHKLLIRNLISQCEMLNYTYLRPILSVKMNKTTMVVCLEDQLYVYRIEATDCKCVHVITKDRTPNNLIALSNNTHNLYLAYPAEGMIGTLEIFNACSLRPVIRISAHDSTLCALAFNPTATMIATASEKGTIIRVFNIHDGRKLVECLRGTKRFVNIHSLAFSADSRLLAVSSNTETVHVFRLANENPSGLFNYFGRKLEEYGILQQVSKYFNLKRAFVTAHLPAGGGMKKICSIASIENIPHILVYSEGDLYVYNLNLFEGGESSLLYQHRLYTEIRQASKLERSFLID